MAEAMTDSPLDVLACQTTAVAGDGLRQVRLCPWGLVKSRNGDFLLDEESVRLIVERFQEHGTMVPCDFEHQTLAGEYMGPDGLARASGWVHKLWGTPGRGLFALVEWTERGREAIRNREYLYPSPTLTIRRSDNRAIELHSVALVTKPAIPAQDVLAAKDQTLAQETTVENLLANQEAGPIADLAEQIKTRLGITEGKMTLEAFLQAVLAKINAGAGERGDTEVASSVRATLGLASDAGASEVTLALQMRVNENAELTAMREAEADRQAKELVNKYVKANVLNPNDKPAMEAAMSLARERPDRLRAMLDGATPYVAPGRTTAPTGRQHLIAKAAGNWRNDPSMQRTCNCEAAVNLALRDAGLEKLTDAERAQFVTSK